MDVYNLLSKLNINYKEQKHEKVYTVDEALQINMQLDGIGCKNLFLKDKENCYYLVLLLDSKRCDLTRLRNYLKVKNIKFCSELELKEILDLEKGSVTPLGIINDTYNKVKIIIDDELIDKELLVHPNRNDRTIQINYKDLIKFIVYLNHSYLLLNL